MVVEMIFNLRLRESGHFQPCLACGVFCYCTAECYCTKELGSTKQFLNCETVIDLQTKESTPSTLRTSTLQRHVLILKQYLEPGPESKLSYPEQFAKMMKLRGFGHILDA